MPSHDVSYFVLQWGNTCGDAKTGCTSSCMTGNLSPHLWYLHPNRRYYSTVLGGGLLEVFALDRWVGNTSSRIASRTYMPGVLLIYIGGAWLVNRPSHFSNSSHSIVKQATQGPVT